MDLDVTSGSIRAMIRAGTVTSTPLHRRPVHAAAITGLISIVFALALAVPANAARSLREIGKAAGLPGATPSYSVAVRDADGDGWQDLLIVHHGSPAVLYRNAGGSGFEIAFKFVDRLHHEIDRHDCAWGDVDRDGLDDLYCVKGARVGTAEKHNELWMQRPDGSFVDRANAFGVLDRWGRGRRTSFIDLNHDAFPDLFVGNSYPRQDEHTSPNRTFINVGGKRFREVDLGLTREVAAFCVQVTDVDGDGWDDVLVCERRGLALYLRADGRFVDSTERYSIPRAHATWARLADLDRDGDRDLTIVTERTLSVRPRVGRSRFGKPTLHRPLENGHGLAIGDIDGRDGPDLWIVEGCVGDKNVDDLLLLNDGKAKAWRRRPTPSHVRGCGDVAAAIDFDHDGAAEFAVLNGSGRDQPLGVRGPDQLFTMGDWRARGVGS